MIDKRRDSRTKKSLAVTYRTDWDDLKTGSRSIDISPGGIRFPVKRNLDLETVLNLEIHWPLIPEPIKITGKVAWAKERISDRSPFELGVQFLEIFPDDLGTIQRICDDQSQESDTISCLG